MTFTSSSCQWILAKSFHDEAITWGIIKIELNFLSSQLLQLKYYYREFIAVNLIHYGENLNFPAKFIGEIQIFDRDCSRLTAIDSQW